MRIFLYSVFVVVVLQILPGCVNHYYTSKTVSPTNAYPKAIEKAKAEKRYFILRSGINVYSVTSVDVDTAKQQFTVQLDHLDSLNMLYVQNPAAKHIKPKSGGSASAAKIFVLMSDSTSYTLDEPHTLLMNKVARIELVD